MCVVLYILLSDLRLSLLLWAIHMVKKKKKKMVYFSGLFRVLLAFHVCCFSLPVVTIILIERRILFENDIYNIIVSLWSFGGNIIYGFFLLIRCRMVLT